MNRGIFCVNCELSVKLEQVGFYPFLKGQNTKEHENGQETNDRNDDGDFDGKICEEDFIETDLCVFTSQIYKKILVMVIHQQAMMKLNMNIPQFKKIALVKSRNTYCSGD